MIYVSFGFVGVRNRTVAVRCWTALIETLCRLTIIFAGKRPIVHARTAIVRNRTVYPVLLLYFALL